MSTEWQAIAATSRRGYTGHEHLDNIMLVHMNGRVFDPNIGRFLSADPNVDGEETTQGWNRYAYVQGRVMSLTDPSGFEGECRDREDDCDPDDKKPPRDSVSHGPTVDGVEQVILNYGPVVNRTPARVPSAPQPRGEGRGRAGPGATNSCGSDGVSAPNNYFGVDIDGACVKHDVCYRNSMIRAACDVTFGANIVRAFIVQDGDIPFGIGVAFVYTAGVRVGGTAPYLNARGRSDELRQHYISPYKTTDTTTDTTKQLTDFP